MASKKATDIVLGGGGGFADLTDDFPQIPDVEELGEEEVDEFNAETFGGEGPAEEWEMEHLAQQTASLLSSGAMQTSPYGVEQRDYEAMLEASISNLVDDDDDVGPGGAGYTPPPASSLPIPPDSFGPKTERLNLFSAIGNTSSSSFFNVASQGSIWGPATFTVPSSSKKPKDDQQQLPAQSFFTSSTPAESVLNGSASSQKTTVSDESLQILTGAKGPFEFTQEDLRRKSPEQPPPLDPSPAAPPAGIKGLLTQLQTSEQTAQSPPMGLSGAKTLEELEAELRKKPQQETPAKAITAEELERQLLASSPVAKPKPAHQPTSMQQQVPRFPPGHIFAGMPIFPPPLHQQPQPQPEESATAANGGPPPPLQLPPFPPALLMNPQFRMTLLAAIASGKPLPPGLPPPAILLPLLQAGGMPPFRPGMPPPLRGPAQQQGVRLPPPQGPIEPQRLQGSNLMRMQAAALQQMLLQQKLQSRQQQQQQGSRQFQPRDPYSGLMGRKERDWLQKIYLQNTMSENPYTDDFYYTMHRHRQQTKASGGKGGKKVEEPLEDFATPEGLVPHVYVPPKFEGALGKVQYLTASFPRQLIDLKQQSKETIVYGSTEGSAPGTPLDTEGPSPAPPLLPNPAISRSEIRPPPSSLRRYKPLLMEVENLWNLMLEAEENTHQLSAALDSATKDMIRGMLKLRSNQLLGGVAGERVQFIGGLRKGRQLLARLLRLLDKDGVVAVLRDIFDYLTQLARKDLEGENMEILFPAVFETSKRLSKAQLYLVLGGWHLNTLEQSFLTQNRFVYCVTLLLLCHCSRKHVALPPEDPLRAVVADCSDRLAAAPQKPPDWLSPDHLGNLCHYLETECGAGEERVGSLRAALKRDSLH